MEWRRKPHLEPVRFNVNAAQVWALRAVLSALCKIPANVLHFGIIIICIHGAFFK